MPLPVAFILLGAAVLLFQWYLRERRRDEWKAAAAALGLSYSRSDPHDLHRLEFPLFGRGDGRGCENVAEGRYRDADLKVFDYWYYDESADSEGRTSRTYHRFTCALTDVPLSCPATSLTPETLLSRIADRLGMRDIELESEEFNRAWQVSSSDRKFASYLLDARMMEWLLTAGGWSFEAAGGSVLAYRGKLAPAEIRSALDITVAFVQRIPRVVHEAYGRVP